jgi:N-terminal acetyltransferase 2
MSYHNSAPVRLPPDPFLASSLASSSRHHEMESLRIAQRRITPQLLTSRSQLFRQLHQSTQPTFRTRTKLPSSFRSFSLNTRPSTSHFTRAFRRPPRRFNSTTASSASSEANLSLSQRLKKLSREYGWSALYIYLLLSALDFPFCFLAVRLVGTDRIGHWEHVVVSTIKEWLIWPITGTPVEDDVEHVVDAGEKMMKAPLQDIREGDKQVEQGESQRVRVLEEDDTYISTDHGYKEAAEAAKGNDATIWTQLALAYAIHKSFIFIRVPLTAAVTPKIVKTLRGWGWNIGPMPKKAKAVVGGGSTTGVNTKGSGVKSD